MNINSLKTNKEIDSMIDKIYPIGSYYETSDTEFNPNNVWGGTWARDTIGYVTVGAIKPDEYRSTDNSWLEINTSDKKGEVNHTLTIDEMASHKHSLSSWKNPTQTTPQPVSGFGFTSNDRAFANVATDGDGTSYTADNFKGISTSGKDQAHNNVQPSVGVMRWHRIS